MSQDNRPQEEVPTPCSHSWKLIRDWYGSTDVINGTMDCSYWRCRRCDAEVSEQPDDWEDPRELDADYRRDAERDAEFHAEMRKDAYE